MMKINTIEFNISDEQMKFLDKYRNDRIANSLDSIAFYKNEYIPGGISKESMIKFHQDNIIFLKKSSYSDLVREILIEKEYDIKHKTT